MKTFHTIIGIYDAITGILLEEYGSTAAARCQQAHDLRTLREAKTYMEAIRFRHMVSKYGLIPTELNRLVEDGEIDLLKHYVFKIH